MAKRISKYLIAVAATQWLCVAIAQEQHDHGRFTSEVDAFHSVLAPVWHARPGKDRSKNACVKAKQMEALAKDIHSMDASALQAAVATLKGKCAGKSADIDGALYDVHEAFHRLIDGGSAKSPARGESQGYPDGSRSSTPH